MRKFRILITPRFDGTDEITIQEYVGVWNFKFIFFLRLQKEWVSIKNILAAVITWLNCLILLIKQRNTLTKK